MIITKKDLLQSENVFMTLLERVDYSEIAPATYTLRELSKDAFEYICMGLKNMPKVSKAESVLPLKHNAHLTFVKVEDSMDVYEIVKDRSGTFKFGYLVPRQYVDNALLSCKHVLVLDSNKYDVIASNFIL